MRARARVQADGRFDALMDLFGRTARVTLDAREFVPDT
jgi:hypothetical protein